MTANGWRLCAAGALSCAAWALASTVLGACASDGDDPTADPETTISVPPPPDAAAGDAETNDADAGPCTGDDCEYFPATCTPDALCPNGPFDPTNPEVGMDWRTRINVIRGRSANDVWLAGAVGAVAHFDGTAWTTSDVATQESQRALWLQASGEISFGSIQRIYGRGLGGGAADAAVSPGGWSLREVPALPDDFGMRLRGGWAPPGADTMWLATETTLWRLRMTPESKLEVVSGISSAACSAMPCNVVLSIHGASAKTIWAVGDFGAALRITNADGDEPAASQLNSMTNVGLTGVWAASDDDVWAVGGSGTIRHYTGDPIQWNVVTDVPTTESLNAVWGTSSSDVWVAGNNGVVLHYDGKTWSRVKIAGLGQRRPHLYSIWSSGPGHVWIGGYGVVLALGGKP